MFFDGMERATWKLTIPDVKHTANENLPYDQGSHTGAL